MKTTTIFKDGHEYKITYKPATKKEPGKKYFELNGELQEVISEVKVNEVIIHADEAVMPLKGLQR